MLKRLRIQNFKGWQDTGEIRMAPITLFFGTNSSGKSSIGQFLMMLKQTAESADRKAVFYPGGRNSAVDLGSYQQMVFHRDITKKIEFEYTWELPDTMEISDPLLSEKKRKSKPITGTKLSFHAIVGLADKDKQRLVVENLEYKLLDNKSDEALSISMTNDINDTTNAKSEYKYKVDATHYSLTRNIGRGWAPGPPVRFYGFPDEVVAYYQNADFVQELNLRHEMLFQSISYLGPLRTKAERLYSWTGVEPESVGYSGENTVAAMLAARNWKIRVMPQKQARSLEEIIALKLKQMELIDDFKVTPISDQRQEYEVKIRTKGSRDSVDIPDVGFGVSQVLPVLVQCFYAPHDSIIIMEQPEIHLHPSAQAILADVMIDVINSREGGHDRNIQLIIETHSEHFLRRLQRRIAEDKISQEKVSAYFANVSKTPAKLEPLELDMFGNIRNWPENFFGDEMQDIVEQSKAAMKKRSDQLSKKENAQNG